MEENELKILWQNAMAQSEQSLVIAQKNTAEITRMKAQNVLSSMKPVKLLALATGLVWVLLLGTLVVYLAMNARGQTSLFFLLSAAGQVLITAIAIFMYLHQLVLIHETDFSRPVLEIQQQLSKLKTSTLNATRVLFLQLPLWTTFYLSEAIFVKENIPWLIMNGIFTLTFTVLSLWLFANINYENRSKKWFQWIFSGKEWQPLMKAMEMLGQLENFNKS